MPPIVLVLEPAKIERQVPRDLALVGRWRDSRAMAAMGVEKRHGGIFDGINEITEGLLLRIHPQFGNSVNSVQNSNCNRRLDRGMRVVSLKRDVLEGELIDLAHLRIEPGGVGAGVGSRASCVRACSR